MSSKKFFAALAALCLAASVSCGSSDSSSSGATDTPLIKAATVASTEAKTDSNGEAQPATTAEEGEAAIKKKVLASKASNAPLTYGTLGEKHTPDADDEDYDLGDYYDSPDGVKLYFNPEEFPPELAMTLEKYFRSYAEADYETYTRCLYPSYIDEMNKFLQKDYSYDLRTSFANQCVSLRSHMGGEFRITRVRLEAGDGDLTSFFEHSSSCFGKDYYEEIKDQVDKFYHAIFYVIADDGTGEHNLLSEYEIVFACKDGRYYTFG